MSAANLGAAPGASTKRRAFAAGPATRLPPRLAELRLDAIVARVGRANKNGFVNVSLYNEDTQQPVTVVLASTDEAGCFMPFGVETTSRFKAAPSFLSGARAERPVEGLELSFAVTEEHVAQLQALERRVKELLVPLSTSLWGKQLQIEDLDRMLHSLVRRPDIGKDHEPTVRCSLVLGATPEMSHCLTRITVLRGDDPDAAVVAGAGWAWAAPLLAAGDDWRRCRVWPTLELRSVWLSAQGFGLRANLTDCVVREEAPRRHESAYSLAVVERLLSSGAPREEP